MDVTELGDRIKGLRNRRGLSQSQMGSLLGITPQAVSKWERGENAPDLLLMPSVAGILNTTVDYLVGHEHRVVRQAVGTVFYCALNGYTAKSEAMNSDDLAIRLSSYFYAITECVLQRGGAPIKYIGDAFLAVFTAGSHAVRWCGTVEGGRC